MKKNNFVKFSIDNYYFQYLFVSICCFTIFALLHFDTNTSYENIQPPMGKYENNIWAESDFMSYYKPAVNYLEFGTFGNKNTPDCLRTVGYPFFIAIMIKCFGNNWLYWTYVFNCLAIPLIFLALYYISNALTNKYVARMVLISSLFLGVYFGRVIYIGTDLFFFLFFIGGIFFLVKYFFENRKIVNIVFYLVFISIAAQIRPSLIYFAIIHVFLFYFLNSKFEVFEKVKSKFIFLFSTTIILLITTSLPSVRNFTNYGFFKPSTVLELNFFDYLTQKILHKECQTIKFDSLKTIVNQELNPKRRMDLQTIYTKEIIKNHVKSFSIVILENIQNVMLDNGITNQIGNYFGYNWKKNAKYTSSKTLLILFYFFALIYVIIYSLFLFRLWLMIKEKKWTLIFFIISIVSIMLLPTFIAGSGGSRHRIAVEWLILIYAFDGLFFIKNKFIGIGA